MKEKTKAYMGAIIDGEGSLTITKTAIASGFSYHPIVGFSNGDKRLIDWAIKHFGGTFRRRERPEYTDNVGYEWYLTGSKCQRSFLQVIRPYVVAKSNQVSLLNEYLSMDGRLDPNAREQLCSAIQHEHHIFSVETDTLDPMSKTGRAYYAGLLDGEGTIVLSRDQHGHFRPAVRIYSAHRDLLTPLKVHYGGSIGPNRENCSQWYVNKKEVIEKSLLYFLPYLITKREQAKTLLEFVRLERAWNQVERNRLYLKMVALNSSREKIQSELHGDVQSAPVGTLDA